MAPRGGGSHTRRPERAETSTSSADESSKMVPINLGDTSALKYTLDSAASEAIIQHGYMEDTSVSNVKIALGLTAISFGLVAQFWPGKLQQNWWLVLWCVVGYTFTTTVLGVYIARVERSTFLFTKSQKDKEAAALRVSSVLPRFSKMYTLKIESASTEKRTPAEFSKSIENYFHEDGYLATTVFQQEVVNLLRKFDASA